VTEPPDVGDLVPEDVSDEELAELARVHALLRDAPAPPAEVPDQLTQRVLALAERRRKGGEPSGVSALVRRRRKLAALALAAALAGLGFVVGFFARGDEGRGEPVEEAALAATPNGPADGRMVVSVLPKDAAGNWPLLGQASGLEPTDAGEFYELWLTRDRRVVLSCGRFTVAADGTAEDVWLNAPYSWSQYDDWVVTRESPGKRPARSKWLLRAPIPPAAT
jgi:hypothetical protein